jgi:hypothetical protein
METKLEQIAAKAVKQRPKSVVREIRTPRSVGTGGGRPPSVTRWALRNGRPYRKHQNYVAEKIGLFCCIFPVQNKPMIYGYARVSTDGQSVTAQVAQLRKHGAGKVFREVESGAKTDRAQLRRVLDQLDAGDVLMVTRLDRLARSTRDLLNTLTAIADRKAGFRSLGDT